MRECHLHDYDPWKGLGTWYIWVYRIALLVLAARAALGSATKRRDHVTSESIGSM